MGFRIVADEHCEQLVIERLRDDGHDVDRVVDVPGLGPGSDDREIAYYARREDRLVLTGDDDFLSEFDPDDHAGLLYVPKEGNSPARIARILSSISDHLAQEDVDDVVYVTDAWI